MRKTVTSTISALSVAALTASATIVRPENTKDALINPDMGWVFYYYDNSNWTYGADTAPGDTLDWFPGMSIIYFRLPWRDLEPEEGKIRWDIIDTVAQSWIAKGKQIAFRLTTQESAYDNACPDWALKAGIEGEWRTLKRQKDPATWRKNFTPDWTGPKFLEKYGNFIAAAGRRWNGNPSVAFIDVGGFGMWGEGHTGFTGALRADEAAVAAIKHCELMKKYFPDTPILCSDDMSNGGDRREDNYMQRYLREQGIGWRDDSIMVAKRPNSWFHPEWARKCARLGLPVMIESRHYLPDSHNNQWYSGGILESTIAHQASYQAVHWWPDDYLKMMKDEVDQVNLRLGYRFELRQVEYPESIKIGAKFDIASDWVNVGVAMPSRETFITWSLLDDKHTVQWTSVDETFDLRRAAPTLEAGEKLAQVKSEVRFGWDWPYCGDYAGLQSPECHHDGRRTKHGPKVPTIKPGRYTLCVSLGKREGTPVVALPLKTQVDSTRRYAVGVITLSE